MGACTAEIQDKRRLSKIKGYGSILSKAYKFKIIHTIKNNIKQNEQILTEK